MDLTKQFLKNVEEIKIKAITSQEKEISEAAILIAEAIKNGGMIQAFGSGHSQAGAMEICGRAGGYIPSKSLTDLLDFSMLEGVEGVGTAFYDFVDIEEHDVFVLISNSGRNPFHIDFAKRLKENGNKIIVVTNLKVSEETSSRHSSGKKLYEFADVVLDNFGNNGDCSINIEQLGVEVGPTSSIVVAYLLNLVILQSMEILIADGLELPVYKSANIDGGPEYNKKTTTKYRNRLYRV